MKHIVSAVPGRLRIKDPQFSDPLAAGKCIDAITREFPVVATRVNPGAQSIVVHYDANLIALSDMRAGTERVLAANLGLQARYPEERKTRRSTRLRLNRYAKIGALTSLAASLAFAYAGPKRLHIITGWVFVACLCAHLAVFRRTLVH